jgi:hypothetical protein
MRGATTAGAGRAVMAGSWADTAKAPGATPGTKADMVDLGLPWERLDELELGTKRWK